MAHSTCFHFLGSFFYERRFSEDFVPSLILPSPMSFFFGKDGWGLFSHFPPYLFCSPRLFITHFVWLLLLRPSRHLESSYFPLIFHITITMIVCRCLMARKFDVKRASELIREYQVRRHRCSFDNPPSSYYLFHLLIYP